MLNGSSGAKLRIGVLDPLGFNRQDAWITDCLEPGDGTRRSLRSLQVNYLEEAKLGEVMVFSSGPPEGVPGTVCVEGTNRASRAAVVQAQLQLNP